LKNSNGLGLKNSNGLGLKNSNGLGLKIFSEGHHCFIFKWYIFEKLK
jgi:hypothetical protein